MDAFISHSSADHTVARRLEQALEAAGLSVWLDSSEIRLGELLGRELQEAILACPVLVLLWSADAQKSRWVNSEWLLAIHQERLVVSYVLDDTPLPQCLATSVFLDAGRDAGDAAPRLARTIRAGPGRRTPLAPVIRGESEELRQAIATLHRGQAMVGERLDGDDVDAAREQQRRLDPVMERARVRWPLDPVIINLDGYHLKNAYMIEFWGAVQAGRGPKNALLDHAERRFFETLSVDPTDPGALNGLGNILFFGRDLDAAKFFHRAAIAQAAARGFDYEQAEHDLRLALRFRPD